jgi:hypothetical protein
MDRRPDEEMNPESALDDETARWFISFLYDFDWEEWRDA